MIEQILSYKTLFFNIVTAIRNAFSPATNKSLHAALIRICTWGDDPLCHSCYDGVIAEMQHTPPHCATVLCQHKHSASITECQWVQFFFSHRGIQFHTFFIHTSMSDTIFSDYSCAVVCHIATKCSGILAGRCKLYWHTTDIHFWHHGTI